MSLALQVDSLPAEPSGKSFFIDLGEGMVFHSHPELAVRGSWEPERMKAEIVRLKKMGMMAVPKLNFSSSHDQWLGKWRPYLSTPEYFRVCAEVIRDVAEAMDMGLGGLWELVIDRRPGVLRFMGSQREIGRAHV